MFVEAELCVLANMLVDNMYGQKFKFYCVCWRREYVCQPLAGLKESYVCQPAAVAGLVTTWAIWRLWQGRAPRNAPLDQQKERNIPPGNVPTIIFGDCCKAWLLEMLLQTSRPTEREICKSMLKVPLNRLFGSCLQATCRQNRFSKQIKKYSTIGDYGKASRCQQSQTNG